MAEEIVVPQDEEFYKDGEQDPAFEHIIHAKGWVWCVVCGEKIALRASDDKFDAVVKSGVTDGTCDKLDDDGPTGVKGTERITEKVSVLSAEQFFDKHAHHDDDTEQLVKEIEAKLNQERVEDEL